MNPNNEQSQHHQILEDDPHRLSQRQSQIDKGKNTNGYDYYISIVPKEKRRSKQLPNIHPTTPNKYEKCSKRSFSGKLLKWRKLLHKQDDSEFRAREKERMLNFEAFDKSSINSKISKNSDYKNKIKRNYEKIDGNRENGNTAKATKMQENDELFERKLRAFFNQKNSQNNKAENGEEKINAEKIPPPPHILYQQDLNKSSNFHNKNKEIKNCINIEKSDFCTEYENSLNELMQADLKELEDIDIKNSDSNTNYFGENGFDEDDGISIQKRISENAKNQCNID